MKKAFSLIELSIVILIIGILIAGVTQSSRLFTKAKISTARSLTESSPVASIKDLALWLETTSEKSFDDDETEDGTAATTWYDINPQVVTKNNATQNTSTNRPNYTEDVINHLPALRFDGSNDFLSLDSTDLVNADLTIFAVVQRRATVAAHNPIIGGQTRAIDQNLIFYYASDTNFSVAIYGSNISFDVAAYSSPTPVLLGGLYSSTKGRKAWENGILKASDAAQTGVLSAFGGASIGRFKLESGQAYFNGDIGEIIIFSKTLSDSDRQAVENYLMTKWGIS